MKRRLDDATPVHTRIATCERELQLVLDPRRWAKLARAQPMVSVLAHYYYAGLLKNDASVQSVESGKCGSRVSFAGLDSHGLYR